RSAAFRDAHGSRESRSAARCGDPAAGRCTAPAGGSRTPATRPAAGGGADRGALTAAEARLWYRVQLPDGSQTIRTGGAATPPTMGQLADYAANKGGHFLGRGDMAPAP